MLHTHSSILCVTSKQTIWLEYLPLALYIKYLFSIYLNIYLAHINVTTKGCFKVTNIQQTIHLCPYIELYWDLPHLESDVSTCFSTSYTSVAAGKCSLKKATFFCCFSLTSCFNLFISIESWSLIHASKMRLTLRVRLFYNSWCSSWTESPFCKWCEQEKLAPVWQELQNKNTPAILLHGGCGCLWYFCFQCSCIYLCRSHTLILCLFVLLCLKSALISQINYSCSVDVQCEFDLVRNMPVLLLPVLGSCSLKLFEYCLNLKENYGFGNLLFFFFPHS